MQAALGGGTPVPLYRSGARREKAVPSLEYFVIATPLAENTEGPVIQWDIWAGSYGAALLIESHLRRLLHRETTEEIGGVLMRTRITDSRDVPDPEPNLIHRAVDQSIEVAREVYVTSVPAEDPEYS